MSTTPRSPGRPRDPELDAAILGVALRFLGEQGYGRMSIDAIAAEAGVSKPTIYRRFATKADLATAALASVITDDAARPADDLGVEEALTRALEHLAQRLRARHSMALVGTLLAEEAQTPELIALFRERVWARRAGLLREVLDRARDRGEVRDDVDVDAVVGMLIGSLYAVHLAQAKIPRDWAGRVVTTALQGLR
jgi:AcrR family transcriptional regulator